MAVGTKEGSQFSTFGNEEPRIVSLWQADLREAANDKWTRTAAHDVSAECRRNRGSGD